MAEKVVDILKTLLHTSPTDDTIDPLEDVPLEIFRESLSAAENRAVQVATTLHVQSDAKAQQEKKDKQNAIRDKIKTVAKLQVVLRHMREKHEEHIVNKNLFVADRLDLGQVRSVMERGADFKEVKRIDSQNERRPDAPPVTQAPEEFDEERSPHDGKLEISWDTALSKREDGRESAPRDGWSCPCRNRRRTSEQAGADLARVW